MPSGPQQSKEKVVYQLCMISIFPKTSKQINKQIICSVYYFYSLNISIMASFNQHDIAKVEAGKKCMQLNVLNQSESILAHQVLTLILS